MLFNISDVNRPYLLPEPSLKRHLFALTWGGTCRLRQTVQFAIEGKQSPAGGLGEMDTDLLQRCPHAIRAQFGTFYDQLAHLIDFPDTRFACGLLLCIIQSRMTKL